MAQIEKVLITGSLGFIFSNFVRYVVYNRVKGYQWITLDNWSMPMSSKNHYTGSKDINQYRADITDGQLLNDIFDIEKPDIVIHAAAQTSVDKSLNNPDLFHQTNVIGTKVLLDICIKYNIKKFIYISTDEIYGSLSSENDLSWNEISKANPRNPYSISKYEGEKLVVASGLPYNITRSSNNYGERQSNDKLLPRAIKCIVENKKIPIYGQGNQIRDWMHVQDNCRGILAVLKRGANNEIYNVGANQEISNIEIVQKICKILGRGYDLIEHIVDPRGDKHDFRYSMDCSKIKKLGWETQFKLMDGLEQTCAWYERNKWALE